MVGLEVESALLFGACPATDPSLDVSDFENGLPVTHDPNSLFQLKSDPIFVVGAARSGTTWVYDIFASHPEVAGAYETWLFTPENGLGALFGSAHWPPRRSGLSRVLSRESLLAETRRFASQVLTHVLEEQHRFLVEKSPSHLYQMNLIHEIYPKARFVHVLRDGRDVAVSVRAAARSWVPQWGQTFGRSISTTALAWKHAIRKARKSGQALGDLFLEIRYEEIKSNPYTSYRTLFDFCGIPYDDTIMESIFQATDFETNYKAKETGFRRGGRVGDWKDHFSFIDSIRFNLAAGDVLIETGYETDRSWLFRRRH